VLYAKAAKKIEAGTKKRASARRDATLLAKFKGQFPPSLARLMAGEGSAENTGFNKIALQIAITSHALGKTEEQVLAACEGLVANHVSDGSRYNTPDKRRAELARMFSYTADNPCYDFSTDAVRSVLPKGEKAPDLDGLTPERAGESLMGEPGDDEDDGRLAGVMMMERGDTLACSDLALPSAPKLTANRPDSYRRF